MSSLEIESFRTRFKYEFDRLLETIADLDDEAVNWKPPAPGANSLLVLVTHALGSADYEMYRAEDADPPTIVCVVGKTELRYHLRADMPPLLEALGLAEVEHNPKNNRMRAL